MRVELSELARLELENLIRTRELPSNTPARVRASLDQLTVFPYDGRALGERYDGLRLIVGPWLWLVVLYRVVEEPELVLVASFVDSRAADFPG